MIRKLAWVLAAALCGTGFALIFGSVSQIPNSMLIAAGIVITACGVHGAWRGTGAVARGERAPRLAWVGGVAAVVGLVGLPLAWGRVPPAVIAGYLLVLATAAIFVPIGLTGSTAAGPRRAADQPLVTSTHSAPRVEYDAEADAAYIYFVPEIQAGGVARTVPVDGGNDPWMVNLDVDDHGRIVGLEVLDASRRLPSALLAT